MPLLWHRPLTPTPHLHLPPRAPRLRRSSFVKYMRSVKKVALKLIDTFVERCEEPALVAQQVVPAMMDPILGDYARNVPDARWGPAQPGPVMRGSWGAAGAGRGL